MQSIQNTVDSDLPESEDADVNDRNAAEKKAKKANAVVMASFTMAFTSELLIVMVYNAMTADWPSGLASKIVVALHEKYASQDMVAKIELRRALNSVLTKRKDDPV
eukprot:1539440-Ditylum_brightwellii.AAC.1